MREPVQNSFLKLSKRLKDANSSSNIAKSHQSHISLDNRIAAGDGYKKTSKDKAQKLAFQTTLPMAQSDVHLFPERFTQVQGNARFHVRYRSRQLGQTGTSQAINESTKNQSQIEPFCSQDTHPALNTIDAPGGGRGGVNIRHPIFEYND